MLYLLVLLCLYGLLLSVMPCYNPVMVLHKANWAWYVIKCLLIVRHITLFPPITPLNQ